MSLVVSLIVTLPLLVSADAENDEGDGAEDDELLPDDARLQRDKYDEVLVYASPVELHAEFHEIDECQG